MEIETDESVVRVASLRRSTVGAFVLHLSVKVSAVLVALIAVRALSVTDYGLLLSMQAFALVGVALWDAGVGLRVTRDIAAGGSPTLALADAFWARISLLGVPVALMAIMLVTILRDRTDSTVLTLTTLVVTLAFGVGLLLISVLQGQHRYLAASLPEVLGRVLSIAWIVYTAVTSIDSLATIWIGLAACEVATTVALGVAVGSAPLRQVLRHRRWTRSRALLIASLPFAANTIFILMYNKFDVNLVRFGAGSFIAGLYGPASRIQDVFGLLPLVLVTATVPVAAAYARDPAALRRLDRKLTKLGLLIALPSAVAIFAGSDVLVDVVLGPRYQDTALAVRILALSLPMIAVTGPRLAILVAIDRGPATTKIYACAFAVAASAQIVLSHRYGLAGAAWGAVAREPVLLLGSHLVLRKVHKEMEREPPFVG